MYINRPIAYILTATDHGTMIINRQDYKIIDKDKGCGVGFNILKRSSIGADDVRTELALIDKRIKFYGTGVVAIDCGANIGVHTIELAKFLNNRGKVYAFEAQEYVYYALAGNIAINNCL